MKKALILILCFLLLTSCGMQDVSTEKADSVTAPSPAVDTVTPEHAPRQELPEEINPVISEQAASPTQNENSPEPATSPVQNENPPEQVPSPAQSENSPEPVASPAENENFPEPTTLTVSITVLGLDGVLIYSAEVEYREGLSAFDLLMETAKKKNIPAVYTGGKSSPYITSIGRFAEKAHGPSSGWIYTVNGESVMKPSNKCILNPDDNVEWKYITEFTIE